MARFLPGLAIALLIGGCGVPAALSLVRRLHDQSQLVPEWTQTDTLELADESLPFASPPIASGLAPPSWTLGYGAGGQAELDYGPVPLGAVQAGPYLRTQGSWSSSRSVPLGPAIAAAADKVPGFSGSVEVLFDVASQAKAAGIASLTRAAIASGSLSVDLANPLARPVDFQAAIVGLEQASDGAPLDMALPVAARSSAKGVWNLAGTVFEPDPSGNLAIWLRAYLPPGSSASLAAGALTVSIRVSQLQFSSLTGTVAYQQTIASRSVPLTLPAPIAGALSPAAARLMVRLDNASAIAGQITPQVAAYGAEGAPVPLTFHAPLSPGEPAFSGKVAPDATTDLVIDSEDSSLLSLLAPGVDHLEVGGSYQAGGENVTVSATDRASADVSVVVPLEFRIEPFGPGTGQRAIAIDPPVAIALSPRTRDLIRQSLRQLSLDVTASDGWRIPLDVALLFSATADPFSDPASLREEIRLAPGPTTSVLALDASQSDQLASVQTMGILLSSAGSGGQIIRLHAQDALGLRVVAHLGVLLSGQLLGSSGS